MTGRESFKFWPWMWTRQKLMIIWYGQFRFVSDIRGPLHVAGTGIPTMIGGEGQLHKSGGMRHWCPRGSKSFRHGLTIALDKARPLGSILLQWPGPGRWLFVASSWISTSSRVLILHLRPPYFQAEVLLFWRFRAIRSQFIL